LCSDRREIRNPKLETRNKSEIRIFQTAAGRFSCSILVSRVEIRVWRLESVVPRLLHPRPFRDWTFEFRACFEIRASSLRPYGPRLFYRAVRVMREKPRRQ